ncbi:MAG: class I SAM-dependent methyltransferase [Bacteroidales bacterium]
MEVTHTRHKLVGPLELWEHKRQFQFDFLLSNGLKETDTLLDFGCGTLRGGIPLICYLNEGNYTGIDIRSMVILEAEKELEENKLQYKKPKLIHMSDINKLLLSDKFDVVLCFSVLIHLEDSILNDSLKFISNYLKPEGCMYANVIIGNKPDGNWNEFSLVERSFEFYSDTFERNNLMIKDLGTLSSYGHITLSKDQDLKNRQRMLKCQLL